jgi:hypothetical protein
MGRTAQQMSELLERNPDTCPVCGFVGRQIRAYIDAVFYEQVTDVDVRARIREAGGFCRYHARLVSEQRDALGTALIMRDLIVNRLRAMASGEGRAGRGGLGRLLTGDRRPQRALCPFCDAEREMDALALDSLMRALADDAEFAARFDRSAGLCIPHFDLAADTFSSRPGWSRVQAVQRRGLEELAARLDVLAQSYDHNKRELVADADVGSWRRALGITSGRFQ